jgi:hypothetical protein
MRCLGRKRRPPWTPAEIHGLIDTHKDKPNAELLSFIKDGQGSGFHDLTGFNP